jgi:hypothetical protein
MAAYPPQSRVFHAHSRRKTKMPFQPGQSGNPAGRPRGSRNKRTVLLENILHGEGETIMRKLIELANRGELGAIRMCMDRLLPAAKGESVAWICRP